MRLDSFRLALPEEPQSPDSNRAEMDRIHALMEKTGSFRPAANYEFDESTTSRPSTSQKADVHTPIQHPVIQRRDSNVVITPRPPSSQRRDSNIAPRPPNIQRRQSSSDGPIERVFSLTPKKNAAVQQHRRDDSKLEPERPSTAKRKKV